MKAIISPSTWNIIRIATIATLVMVASLIWTPFLAAFLTLGTITLAYTKPGRQLRWHRGLVFLALVGIMATIVFYTNAAILVLTIFSSNVTTLLVTVNIIGAAGVLLSYLHIYQWLFQAKLNTYTYIAFFILLYISGTIVFNNITNKAAIIDLTTTILLSATPIILLGIFDKSLNKKRA